MVDKGDSEAAVLSGKKDIFRRLRDLNCSRDTDKLQALWCETHHLLSDPSWAELLREKNHCQRVGSGAGTMQTDALSAQCLCRTRFSCWFHVWAIISGIFLLIFATRWICSNAWSAIRWCCRLPAYCRLSSTMKAVHYVNYGMDKKSWDSRSACSEQIKSTIELSLSQLFSRCDVSLLMVGSLSSRLGKSLCARPEAEDSLQEYRLTRPVLGADADFMVVLQVPVAPADAGGRQLSWHDLEGVSPYHTISFSGFPQPHPAPFMPAARTCGGASARGATPRDPPGLEVMERAAGPRRADPRLLSRQCSIDYTLPELDEDEPPPLAEPREAGEQCEMLVRPPPEGAIEPQAMQRSASCSTVRLRRQLTTLEVTNSAATPPGFARVQLLLERVLPEDRRWWQERLSETSGDGAVYLSSLKARRLMEEMFGSLQLAIEQDRSNMSIVDSCLADYRGVPSYEKEVRARGPAIMLKLTQRDDRAFARLTCLQNSCCYWLCLCFVVVMLIPFSLWIFLTGGSWPVRKCIGGACCSIYYCVTLLLPMVLVLPVTMLVLMLSGPGQPSDNVYVVAMIAYLVVSACFASVFVCVSQCFFKLPTIFYGDFVTALVCPVWPIQAREFKTRTRLWPSRNVVDTVVRCGCHLVPKSAITCACVDVRGEAPCQEAHLLWRYSFSQAEVTLSKNIPEHYRRAYLTLKWLVKKYIMQADCPTTVNNSNFRSYYLKTVLYWELDQAGVLECTDGVEEVLLHRLALRLQRYIRQRYLSHFFIPEVNLLLELTDVEFDRIDRLLNQVLENPARLIKRRELTVTFYAIALCESLFCTPGRDYRSELCFNYASRLHQVW
ncbi:uncharacterized protein LOC119111302 [Pollicipes pollicipes]|uniref:uncharacterized protein LOC119111302 n=1 Tax=Pollicipes pollicipes TaxID=41117 RepID=UPI001884D6FA|nr:uncharacterized protein LOC119111302 [Pollicipes pollicipes]